jgi:hypothetical protein
MCRNKATEAENKREDPAGAEFTTLRMCNNLVAEYRL